MDTYVQRKNATPGGFGGERGIVEPGRRLQSES